MLINMKNRKAMAIKIMLEEAGSDDFLTSEEKIKACVFIQNTFENPTEEEQEVHEIVERLMPRLWTQATREFFTSENDNNYGTRIKKSDCEGYSEDPF